MEQREGPVDHDSGHELLQSLIASDIVRNNDALRRALKVAHLQLEWRDLHYSSHEYAAHFWVVDMASAEAIDNSDTTIRAAINERIDGFVTHIIARPTRRAINVMGSGPQSALAITRLNRSLQPSEFVVEPQIEEDAPPEHALQVFEPVAATLLIADETSDQLLPLASARPSQGGVVLSVSTKASASIPWPSSGFARLEDVTSACDLLVDVLQDTPLARSRETSEAATRIRELGLSDAWHGEASEILDELGGRLGAIEATFRDRWASVVR